MLQSNSISINDIRVGSTIMRVNIIIITVTLIAFLLTTSSISISESISPYYEEPTIIKDRLEFIAPWDEQIIDDGILTYQIHSHNVKFKNLVYDAIDEWNMKLKGGIKMIEHDDFTNDEVNIEFHYMKDMQIIDKTVDADEFSYTSSSMSKDGDIIKSKIVLNSEWLPTSDEMLLPLLKHEIGHALGLGFMTTQKYLMNGEVYPNRLQHVSHCEAGAAIVLNFENRDAKGIVCHSPSQ